MQNSLATSRIDILGDDDIYCLGEKPSWFAARGKPDLAAYAFGAGSQEYPSSPRMSILKFANVFEHDNLRDNDRCKCG